VLFIERDIENYDYHLIKTISGIGFCIPILSKMDCSMIQMVGIIVAFSKILSWDV
jgi:hypothetical protein